MRFSSFSRSGANGCVYEYKHFRLHLHGYGYADSLMTFLIYQYVDVLTIPHAYENVLLYVYCHSVHFLEYLPDCKNYFDFLYIHFLEYVFSLSFCCIIFLIIFISIILNMFIFHFYPASYY